LQEQREEGKERGEGEGEGLTRKERGRERDGERERKESMSSVLGIRQLVREIQRQEEEVHYSKQRGGEKKDRGRKKKELVVGKRTQCPGTVEVLCSIYKQGQKQMREKKKR